ncbi:Hypothetical predicted protein [Mytilus galloprovincialis]|uniref:Uncharacterized protein n=1 Tax=Mytilus galloprovincialis TaxID=29158 RepID=A0A8B6HCE7_MYTGA|nr:Hypothetical predicted protein [Mytilus galloprovincialis]
MSTTNYYTIIKRVILIQTYKDKISQSNTIQTRGEKFVFGIVLLKTIYKMFAISLVVVFVTVSYCNGNYDKKRLLRQNLSKRYNPELLPILDSHQPLQIKAKLYVMALQGLDDKSQVLTASVFWYFTWKDEIFRWDHNIEYKNISKLTVKVRDVWVPEIYIVNDVRDMSIRSSGYNKDYVIVRSNGNMTWFPAKELQTSCVVDVSKYPFDTQECSIKMEAWYHDNTSFVLNTIGSGIDMSEVHFVQNGEWEIVNLSSNPFQYQDYADNSSAYSCIHYTLILKRRSSYHLITTAFPFVILMAINLLVVVIPTECGEKLGFCMSQFLTMIVFLTLIGQNMPSSSLTISYLTFLISLQILVSGITILIVAISIYLQTRRIEDRPSFVVRIIFSPLRYFQQNYFKKSFTPSQDSIHEDFTTWLDIDKKLNCGLNILLLLNVIGTVSVFVFVIY